MGTERKKRVRVFAGDYNDLLRFESIGYEPDEGGGRKEIWSTFIDQVGGSIEPYVDEELFASMQIKPTSAAKVHCHYFPGLDESMRMYSYADGKFYNIVSAVNLDNADREWEIIAVYRRGQWV